MSRTASIDFTPDKRADKIERSLSRRRGNITRRVAPILGVAAALSVVGLAGRALIGGTESANQTAANSVERDAVTQITKATHATFTFYPGVNVRKFPRINNGDGEDPGSSNLAFTIKPDTRLEVSNPLEAHLGPDGDWYAFTGEDGQLYWISHKIDNDLDTTGGRMVTSVALPEAAASPELNVVSVDGNNFSAQMPDGSIGRVGVGTVLTGPDLA